MEGDPMSVIPVFSVTVEWLMLKIRMVARGPVPVYVLAVLLVLALVFAAMLAWELLT
jgi:hypothetical protein